MFLVKFAAAEGEDFVGFVGDSARVRLPTFSRYLLGSVLRLMESQLRFNVFLNI